jgi:hypothetical protein
VQEVRTQGSVGDVGMSTPPPVIEVDPFNAVLVMLAQDPVVQPQQGPKNRRRGTRFDVDGARFKAAGHRLERHSLGGRYLRV